VGDREHDFGIPNRVNCPLGKKWSHAYIENRWIKAKTNCASRIQQCPAGFDPIRNEVIEVQSGVDAWTNTATDTYIPKDWIGATMRFVNRRYYKGGKEGEKAEENNENNSWREGTRSLKV